MPNDLHPDFEAALQRIEQAMRKAGMPVTRTSGRRSALQQAMLYARGRVTPEGTVTNADGMRRKSYHQRGLAVDFTALDPRGRPMNVDAVPPRTWKMLGDLARGEGLEWGGEWKSIVDKPHVQVPESWARTLDPSGWSDPTALPTLPSSLPPPRNPFGSAAAMAGARAPARRDTRPAPVPAVDDPIRLPALPASPPRYFPTAASREANSMSPRPLDPGIPDAQLPRNGNPFLPWANVEWSGMRPGEFGPKRTSDVDLYAEAEAPREKVVPAVGEDVTHLMPQIGEDVTDLMGDTMAPVPSHAPTTARTGRGAMAEEVGKGALAGLMNTVYGGGDLIRRGLGMERVIKTPEAQAAMTPPDTPLGKAAYGVERIAEFAIPLGRVAKAVKGASFAKRLAAEGAAGAGVAGVQSGGEPVETLLGGTLGAMAPAAGQVARGIKGAATRAAAGAQEGGLGGAVAGAVRTVAPSEPRVLITQAIKPRSTDVQWGRHVERALPEIKASEATLGTPITNVDEFLAAIKDAKQRVRGQYDQMAGPRRAMGSTVDLNPVANAMEESIPKKLQLERPEAAIRLRESAQVYRQRFALEDAEQLLKETNADLESFYSKYPPSQRKALAADPEAARLYAQATALRKAIYSTLDAEGQGEAARELQRRYGALLDLETETYRRANVAARQQPQSLSEQLSAARAAGEIARGAWRMLRGNVMGAADIAAGVAMRDTAKFLKEQQTTNRLIQRAMAGVSQTPVPVAMPVQRPVRGLLERGPLITPRPADPSFVRGVPAKSTVAREPKTGRMKRVYTGEPK